MMMHSFLFSSLDGVSLINEDGRLGIFFPNNSFVANTTLTRTDTPRGNVGNDHIACYSGDPQGTQITWHSSSAPLQRCRNFREQLVSCEICGPICQNNGGVGVDPQLNGRTDIHMYTGSVSYVNQDLECRVSGGQRSAFIAVYLKDGGGCQIIMVSGNWYGEWPTVPICCFMLSSIGSH